MSLPTVLQGRAHVYGRAHINTDEIIPARYLNVHEEAELAKHAMEDIDTDFVKKVQPGDFIVAGEDFGCGSSREHAIWAYWRGREGHHRRQLRPLFFRNAVNNGFLVLECPEAVAAKSGQTPAWTWSRRAPRGGDGRHLHPTRAPQRLRRGLPGGGRPAPYLVARMKGGAA